MRLSVCLCVFPSQAIPRKLVIIVKLGTVTASGMRMHHVLIILILTFVQGHTVLNREYKKCSIISEIVQPMPITFAVKIVRLKVYIIFCQFDDLALHSKSQLRLKRDKCLTCTIIAITRRVFKVLWHSNLVWR